MFLKQIRHFPGLNYAMGFAGAQPAFGAALWANLAIRRGGKK